MSRIIFMGSPEVALPSLERLVGAGHRIVGVVTQPDRPKGRGQHVVPSPVKVAAQKLELMVFQPDKINTPDFVSQMASLHPDFIVVVAFGRILGRDILKLPRLACVNLHFSLLPKYRGASCVAHALLNGDLETGVTTMLINEGLDTGDILLQKKEGILPEDTCASLSGRLAILGADQLVKTLEGLADQTIQVLPQREEASSYAPLVKKQEGLIDWNKGAQEIYRRYQAFTPWPGVFSFIDTKRIIFTKMRPVQQRHCGESGTLVFQEDGRLWVCCGEGAVEVLELKVEGKNVLKASDFVRGLRGRQGLVFGK